MNSKISIALKGAAMGMAEVVPGVSGGTIAFVTGIYEQLLESITAVDPKLLGVFKKGGVKAVWLEIQGPFLLNLLVGMAAGLIFGVFAITYLLEAYPPIIWAFFFGLILASAWYIGRMVKPWSIGEILAIVAGFGIALAIVMGTPAQGTTSLWFVFLSGAIAISALLLPGISGSFILLLLGMYSYVVPSVKSALSGGGSEAYMVVIVFALGCLTGLVTFSRVLSWLFKKYPQVTLALLTGFMLGSLYKLWPWREVTSYLTGPDGELVLNKEGVAKVLTEIPVSPSRYFEVAQQPSYLIASIVAALIGMALIYGLSKVEKKPV
jgi:putative membrane protein